MNKEDEGGGSSITASTLLRSLWLLKRPTAVSFSKFRVLEFVPQSLGNALSITLQPVARDIAADVLDIASEEGKRVGIETRVDGLGEVNETDVSPKHWR